jgi:hypothetical protein
MQGVTCIRITYLLGQLLDSASEPMVW